MRKIITVICCCFICFHALAQNNPPQRFDVIIDEIFPDPDPSVGLPDGEYIELKNTSGRSIDLKGWRLTSITSRSGLFPSTILQADSFLIVTSRTNSALYSSYGRVIGLSSFPSLVNAGTTLSLISGEGITVHSVSYNAKWYQNDVKSDGGWSLEMIDTGNPCNGENNWKASSDLKGGTPGTTNSINGTNPDRVAPALVRASALDSVTLLLTFSEPVDSTVAATIRNYNISDGINTPLHAICVAPLFMQVKLTLPYPIAANKAYTVTASNITDCSGNSINALNIARFGLAASVDSLDIIINEILFNPKPGSVDYLEIYNRSNKVFDLKDVYIANRSLTTNVPGSLRQVTTESILIFPGDFYVITENREVVKRNYYAKNPDNFIDVQMPSFPDGEGVVVLLNGQGMIIDELHYNAKWHFALIDNDEGISLERMDYNKPTQNKDNWTSAASTAGYGTPTYQNSQVGANLLVKANVTVSPKTFSPDGDGYDDFASINYQMSEPGFVANITIYDASGRPVKVLAKNATLAPTGSFKWDGLDDKLRKAPVGVYVLYTEVFNLNGKTRSFKNTVVVARRF